MQGVARAETAGDLGRHGLHQCRRPRLSPQATQRCYRSQGVRIRQRILVGLAGLAASAGVVGCASAQGLLPVPSTRPPAQAPAITPAPTGPLAPRPTSATTPASRRPKAPCSNAGVIANWPVARRAAMVVVAPVLDFDMGTVEVAANAGVGGILFLGGAGVPSDLAGQLDTAWRAAAPGVRPLVMADEEGGGVQRLLGGVSYFPWAREMAQTMSAQQVERLGARVGAQMLRLGVDVDLAPVLDLDGGNGPSAIDPDGLRSFSSEAGVAARYGTAFSDGLASAGILAVVKHFPGLGGSTANTDYGAAATPPLSTLEVDGLAPFRAALAAGVRAVMVANASVPGLTALPASLSKAAVDGLLRDTLGFQGLVLTDSLSAGAISQAGYDLPRAAVAAISAGDDMVLFGSTLTAAQRTLLSPGKVANTVHQITAAMITAINGGSLPTSRLDDAVEHIVTAAHVDLCQ